MKEYWLCTQCMLTVVNGELPAESTPEQDKPINDGLERLGWLSSDFNTDTADGISYQLTKICECCLTYGHAIRYRFQGDL